MINPINYALLDKLRNNTKLDDNDKQLLIENEQFLQMLLSWLSWNNFTNKFEAVIDNDETNKAISKYFEERKIE